MRSRAFLSTQLLVVGALGVTGLVFAPPASAASCQGKTVTIEGTANSDELIGTSGADVIAGGGGNDVIKGGDGNDTICGGDGHDGLHGGQGADAIQGGNDSDLIVGGGDNDTLEGSNGSDALYGGSGTDTLYGGSYSAGVHTDSELDFLSGGLNPVGAEDSVNSSVGDEAHLENRVPTQLTACPPAFAWHFGAYGGPVRLVPRDSVNCQVIRGTVTGWVKPADNDGDGKFKIWANSQWYGVEFMPRDKGALPDLGYREGLYVRVLGAWVTDNHGNNEIHPVFAIDANDDGVWDYFSGPENAGSPRTLNPGGTDLTKRFCWHEGGSVCAPWNTSGRAFN